MADPISLVGPDGREYEYTGSDPDAVQAAVSKGFRVTTPEAPRTLGEQAQAL